MGRKYISRTRFKWKTPNWQELDNLESIWIYSQEGILSFEMKIEKSVQIPELFQKHARNSKNITNPQFIMIRDPHMIGVIGENLKKLSVQGAQGKSVYLGKISIQKKDVPFDIPVYSTLADWYDWFFSVQKLEEKIA